MIHTARAHGLEVMLGCMIESNAAIAAACHLAPLLDYADFDGHCSLRSARHRFSPRIDIARNTGVSPPGSMSEASEN